MKSTILKVVLASCFLFTVGCHTYEGAKHSHAKSSCCGKEGKCCKKACSSGDKKACDKKACSTKK